MAGTREEGRGYLELRLEREIEDRLFTALLAGLEILNFILKPLERHGRFLSVRGIGFTF